MMSGRDSGMKIDDTIIKIWEDLLDRSDLTLSDDFFESGGHSLLAVHLISVVNEQLSLDTELDVIAIFLNSGLGEFINYVEGLCGGSSAAEGEG